ncbi:hypothetical protein [Citrobacter pasteurii]|nr:hypothetical protein [Citrobacter pasteurii]
MTLITPLMNAVLAGINAGPAVLATTGTPQHVIILSQPFGIRAPNTAHLTSFKEYDAANTRAIM